MRIPTQTAPRFAGVLPIRAVYNERDHELYDVRDTDRSRVSFMESGFRALDKLVERKFPYSGFHPEVTPEDPVEAELHPFCNRVRQAVLERIALIDPDFAADPLKRIIKLSGINRQYYLLTGEDAQPVMDAYTKLDNGIDEDEADQTLQREAARLDKLVTPHQRSLTVHVRPVPETETHRTGLLARLPRSNHFIVTDITVNSDTTP